MIIRQTLTYQIPDRLFTKLSPKIKAALRESMNDELKALRDYVIETKLSGQMLNRRTGKLQESVKVSPARIEGNEILVGSVTAGGETAPYARIFQNRSSRPYDILPAQKRALSFILNGVPVVYSKVRHPGAKYAPFLRLSLRERQTYMLQHIRYDVYKAIQEAR